MNKSELIVRVARDARPFLEVGDYLGPDRRFVRPELYEGEERRADRLRDNMVEFA